MKHDTQDPVLQRTSLHLVIRDEARHVTFGVNYLEEFVKTLSQEAARRARAVRVRSVRRDARLA